MNQEQKSAAYRYDYMKAYRKRRRETGIVYVGAFIHESNRERALKYLKKLQIPKEEKK